MMSITETNAKLTTVASDTDIKNALAQIVDKGDLTIVENVQILTLQKAVKEYMSNCAPALFSTVTKHKGNPIFKDLVLNYEFDVESDKISFEAEYSTFLTESWTFDTLNKITLGRDHIPYPNAESLLDKFILFED